MAVLQGLRAPNHSPKRQRGVRSVAGYRAALREHPVFPMGRPLFLIVCSVALVSVNSHCCKRAARP
jgi:hypothetical protein